MGGGPKTLHPKPQPRLILPASPRLGGGIVQQTAGGVGEGRIKRLVKCVLVSGTPLEAVAVRKLLGERVHVLRKLVHRHRLRDKLGETKIYCWYERHKGGRAHTTGALCSCDAVDKLRVLLRDQEATTAPQGYDACVAGLMLADGVVFKCPLGKKMFEGDRRSAIVWYFTFDLKQNNPSTPRGELRKNEAPLSFH